MLCILWFPIKCCVKDTELFLRMVNAKQVVCETCQQSLSCVPKPNCLRISYNVHKKPHFQGHFQHNCQHAHGCWTGNCLASKTLVVFGVLGEWEKEGPSEMTVFQNKTTPEWIHVQNQISIPRQASVPGRCSFLWKRICSQVDMHAYLNRGKSLLPWFVQEEEEWLWQQSLQCVTWILQLWPTFQPAGREGEGTVTAMEYLLQGCSIEQR